MSTGRCTLLNKKWIAHSSDRSEAKVNLLMFVYAGGSPSFFAPWKKYLDESINIYPILYPGREIRKNEVIPGSLNKMIRDFVDETPELFSKPFVTFGQCTGSIIAYETAKYVYEKYGRFPLSFITSSMNSPRSYDCYKAIYDDEGNEASDEILIKRMIKQGTVSPDFAENQNFINYYMPIFRGDLRMLENVDSAEPLQLECNIYCISGIEDEFVSEEGLADWRNYTSKNVYYEKVHGGHFYLNENRDFILNNLNKYIKNDLRSV